MLHNGSVTITKREKVYDYLYLTSKQAVLIAVLVVVMTFFSILWISRTEYTPDPNVFIWYAGFPFDAIKMKNIVYKGWYIDIGTVLSGKVVHELLWCGMIMNLIIYIIFSTIIVKLATWIGDEIEYHRYHKS